MTRWLRGNIHPWWKWLLVTLFNVASLPNLFCRRTTLLRKAASTGPLSASLTTWKKESAASELQFLITMTNRLESWIGKAAQKVLFFLGITGIVAAIGILALGLLVIQPAAQEATKTLTQSLEVADRTAEIASKQIDLLHTSIDTAQSAAALLDLLPETLIGLRGTLLESALLLERTSGTLDALESGITGILIPSPEAGRNVTAARKLSTQLHQLSKMIGETQGVAGRLSDASSDLPPKLSELESTIPELRRVLADTQNMSQGARKALNQTLTPGVWAITILASFFSALLGSLLLAMSGLYQRLSELRPAYPRPNDLSIPSRRAS